MDVLIVGAGFAGMYMLYKARERGLSARIIEASAGVGGTWYFNRYPGARVDIQSMEYSFGFSETLQQSWHWSERYAAQPELLRYANHIADRFELRSDIEFNTRVVSASFEEARSRWQVRADTGAVWDARFLVMASGPLSSPNIPQFAGMDQFEGPVYHTARWPHEPVDFSGKRVAIIGTGSSAVQAIPVIAERAAHLTVFQRTATYAVPARNGPLDPAYEAHIKADYAGFRARNLLMPAGFNSELPPNPTSALAATPAEREAAFEARWKIGGFGFLGAFYDLLLNEQANQYAAEFVRQKIRQTVRDPKVAQLLCPTHTIGCKRLCIDTDYYETFNRSNLQLVDISQDPIESITAKGLRTGRQNFEFDELVLATGFDAMTGTLLKLDIRGRAGLSIQQKWRDGPANYLGLMIQGFPNFFNVIGPGSTSAFTNVIVAIEHHVNWIAECIGYLDANGHETIEASQDAELQWVSHVNKVAQKTLYLTCNSWYLGANITGKPRIFMPLIGFPAYAERCRDVVNAGYAGFEFDAAPAAASG